MNKPLVFIPSLFFMHAQCPHWIWHELYSDPKDRGEFSELTLKLLEQGGTHEKDYISGLEFEEVSEVDPAQAFAKTLELMRKGAGLIYQGGLEYEANGVLYRGRPDLLKKMPGKSLFGDYQYQPIDIKSSREISTEHKHQLMFYGIILEQVQKAFPKELAIINRNKEKVFFEYQDNHRKKTIAKIDEILWIMKGNKPDLKLTSSCKESPWYKKCVEEAQKNNDIALIYKLDYRSFPDLRKNGINTVNDAANMDIQLLPKIYQASEKTLQRVKIQAQSLRDNDLKWLAKPVLPDAPLKLFFDIEGDPLKQLQYLFGFWVSGDPEFKYARIGEVREYPKKGKYFLYFLAESPEQEEVMWKKFLEWVDILPEEYSVFHYADYEKTWTNKLSKTYGANQGFAKFYSKLFDLEDARTASVIFPLYFYSIKDIAKSRFVNFKWQHEKAGGAQSIFWYEKWLETGDKSVLNDIINYNEDDVRATEAFYLWLKNKGGA